MGYTTGNSYSMDQASSVPFCAEASFCCPSSRYICLILDAGVLASILLSAGIWKGIVGLISGVMGRLAALVLITGLVGILIIGISVTIFSSMGNRFVRPREIRSA